MLQSGTSSLEADTLSAEKSILLEEREMASKMLSKVT